MTVPTTRPSSTSVSAVVFVVGPAIVVLTPATCLMIEICEVAPIGPVTETSYHVLAPEAMRKPTPTLSFPLVSAPIVTLAYWSLAKVSAFQRTAPSAPTDDTSR